MLTKFKNHLEQNFPYLKEKKLLLAVSGGLDSMVLMHLFQELRYSIGIAHCNFQLRGKESDADENFVKLQAEKFQIPIFSTRFETEKFANTNKLSIQLAARKLRYDWFYQLLEEENYDYLLTAHHLDDQLETFLINLSRGTGIEGLTGIPATNDKIMRPLLPFSREEICAFAEENSLSWREDSSNTSTKYLRNKIRHEVIPILKTLNSNFLPTFENTLEHLNQANALVNDASRNTYDLVVKQLDDQHIFDIPKVLELPNYKAYLYQWLKDFGFTAWVDIYDLVNANSGKQIFSETHVLLKDRNRLLLFEKTENHNVEIYFVKDFESKVNIPLKLSFCKVANISNVNANCIFVDENQLKLPLVIRKWQEGDVFYPTGMIGKKKLSKFFKDEKYSLLDKQNQWLLCSNYEIVWVIGKRADQRFLTNENTKNYIKITLE
ncbi:tRNA lysidine(34) synthetase TilS [Flavobacterium tibetense]|uniref:tRNA(Ile)-lysidine synthase n=1 Tax=Flavobacterium tibetense TaxID=2233533 RepID=A0A365NZ22_9FLAO|nr:tRNA lysidine(34) synthetase TilS [Flavobacterium tibetense]RBA27516.1 tRNA lysidine(34) synthetase TilS [Flavobacterium tibetense]